MTYDIPLPRLVNANGQEIRRIYTPFASVNLNITPLSTAVIELPPEDTIPPRSFVEMFTASGSAGIFRTSSPEMGYGGLNSTVQMEHASCEIGDYLVTADLEKEETALQAIAEAFGYYRGTLWQLGNIASTDTVILQCDHDNVLQVILSIMEQIPGYMLSFDFNTNPWTVSVVARPTMVSAEGRLSRNIAGARIIEDDSELCTRLYLDGLPNGYIESDTISQYGIVERQLDGYSDLTVEKAQRIANLYLEKHKHPRLTIEIDAQDLYQITGETLDRLQLGGLYRLALPDAGITREETIISIQYNDIYGDRGNATVTLSEEEDKATLFLHKTSAGGSGTRKKLDEGFKEFWTKFDQQDEYIDMVAGQSGEAGDILRQAGMYLNAQGVLVYAEDNVNNVGAKLRVNADAISAEVADRVNGFAVMSSTIEQTASQIRSEVSDTASGLYSQITQTASSIRSEVSSSISSAYHSIIEQTDSHIRSEVASSVSGIYSSVIEQTGSYIRSEIDAAASGIASSVIEQTGSYIRSEIENAASELSGSVIAQTESYVRIQVGQRSNKVYHSEADPTTNPEFELREGDVWNKDNDKRTWAEMGADAWSDATTYAWQEYLGPVTKVWHDNKWVEVSSAQAEALATQGIIETQEEIRLAKADIEGNRAQLELTSSRLRSQIVNEKTGLTSLIEQTASQIRTEVSNSVSGLSSSITQTASQIRAEVNSSISGLQSSLTQTASQIRAEVTSKTDAASIVAGINAQTGSYVKIAAKNVNLSGYTTVSELEAAKARITDLEGDTAKFNSLMAGTTTAAYLKASTMVASGSFTFKGYSLSFYQMTDLEGRTRYLLGHA